MEHGGGGDGSAAMMTTTTTNISPRWLWHHLHYLRVGKILMTFLVTRLLASFMTTTMRMTTRRMSTMMNRQRVSETDEPTLCSSTVYKPYFRLEHERNGVSLRRAIKN